jgi:hypothetical protein
MPGGRWRSRVYQRQDTGGCRSGRRSRGCRISDDVGGRSTVGRDKYSDKIGNALGTDRTRLSPRQIWSDDKLDVPVAENTKNHAPEIPLVKTRANLKQFGGGILLAGLVATPAVGPVPACLVLFVDQVWLDVLPALLRDEAGKNEDGFDSKLFERPEVCFDALGEGEGEATSCGEQRLFSGRILVDGLEIVPSVDTESRV